MNKKQYTELSFEHAKSHFVEEVILLVTATDLETSNLHEQITPISGQDTILKVFEGDLTYYFGVLGMYKVVHVQCGTMGSIGRASSIKTVTSAVEKLKSKVVIMVGIAFGVDSIKQNIGDVLVSESIIPYNSKRVGKGSTIERGIECPASKKLISRFKSIKQTWEYLLVGDKRADLIFTRLLSGEELIDNIHHRNKLIADHTDSKGGEMEGAGIYAACDQEADWILIKGICDFADGDKGSNKKERQNIAMKSSISACLELFNSTTAFSVFDIETEQKCEDANQIEVQTIKSVLFDLYDKSKEPFYIKRDEDQEFQTKIKHSGVWIYGPPGVGKTNLILRNLIQVKNTPITISCASLVGLDSLEFFKEILYSITSCVGESSQKEPSSFNECSKAIIAILQKHFQHKSLILFIEEIPINSDEDYENFSNKLFSLLISKNLAVGLDDVLFVLSSINSPTGFIKPFQQKVNQYLIFFPLTYWSHLEIKKLTELIKTNLLIDIPSNINEELVVKSKGSPRFIKKFFRSVISVGKNDPTTLSRLIQETHRELNQYSND